MIGIGVQRFSNLSTSERDSPAQNSGCPRVYVLPICRRHAYGFVTDYLGAAADVALAVAAFIGTYYASVSSRLFRGDLIMERVWKLATTAFTVIALFSVLDIIFIAENSSLVLLHLFRFAAVFAVAIFVVAMMLLVRWGKSTMESGTPQSRQYPLR